MPKTTYAPAAPGREYLQQYSTQTGLQQQLPNMLEDNHLSQRIASESGELSALKSTAQIDSIKPLGIVSNQQLRGDRNVVRAGGDNMSHGGAFAASLGPAAGLAFGDRVPFIGGRLMGLGLRGSSSTDQRTVSSLNRREFQVNHAGCSTRRK